MKYSKFAEFMYKYGETDTSIARKLQVSTGRVRKWRLEGVKRRYDAYAIAYALECNHRDLLENRVYSEGWDLTPCLPGLE